MRRENGFILTSSWEDTETNHLLKFFGTSKTGPFEIHVTNFKPLFFVSREIKIPSSKKYERKKVELKNFAGIDVDALYFNTQKDLYETRDFLKQKGIRTFEADVRPPERFLMEHFINGEVEIEGECEEVSGTLYFKNPTLRTTNFTPKFKILSLDIETSRGNDLYSIAIHQRGPKEIKKVFMIGEGSNIPAQDLYFFKSEEELLVNFLREFQGFDPDIIIGWHVIGFDLLFLDKKMSQHKIPFTLGRGNSKLTLSERRSLGHVAFMNGRVVIDGIQALRNNFFKYENYKLNTVAQTVLGTGKDIEGSSESKVEEIERRFLEDKEALAKYNLLDCTLVLDIFERLSLIDLIFNRSIISGLAIDKQGLSTAAFDHYFLPRIHRKGFVASNVIDIQREQPASGGHVLEPVVGVHNYVLVLDFKSLYPSIIRTFNIDPLSRLKAESDPVETPVGTKFSKVEHILPEFIEELMNKRKVAKDRGNKNLSQAIKILMNSFYGVMGSTGSRFYHADLPRSITGTGQWAIKEAISFLTSRGYEILYGDTDSVFIKIKDNERFNIKETGENLAKAVNDFFATKIYREFKVDSKLEIEFEKYYRKFFLPKNRAGVGGAKKRYAGLLVNNGKEELSFVGLEYIRSDWTKLAKNFQYELFRRFFKDEEIESWIKDFVARIKDKEFDGDLVYKKRLSKNPKEYTKNVPPHVKAALQLDYNEEFPRKEISYVITGRGPVPIELKHSDFDYNHYIEKQIKPLADGVLDIQGKCFEDLMLGDQLSLF